MTESKDPAPNVPVREKVVERSQGSTGSNSPNSVQERKPSQFRQKLRGMESNDHGISEQSVSVGSVPAQETFKMQTLQESLDSISTSTPKAARGGVVSLGSASKRKGGLGTVSFYNNTTNCRSPAHPIFSPSQGRIVVDVEGQDVPYEQWYKQISRRTPLRFAGSAAAPSADQTAKTLSFHSADSAPEPDAPRCQFLQKPLSDLAPRERHQKMLRFSNTVTETLLRKALAKLTGEESVSEDASRNELIERYVAHLHPEEEAEEEIEEEIEEGLEEEDLEGVSPL